MRALAISIAALGAACAACAAEVRVPVVSLPVVGAADPPARAACLPTAPEACHALGRRALAADPRTAYQFQSLACERGVPAACADLGWMKLHGVWGESNPAGALSLIEGACRAGVRESCVTLGVLYRDVRHDDATAIGVFVHYCDDLGVGAACDELGRMVEGGRGFAPDLDAARRLYEHACERGAGAGCGDLGRTLLGVDDRRARALLERACRAGDGPACLQLGLRTPRADRALARFERACNLGAAAACALAASSIDADVRSPAALWWLSRACDQADASSCRTLGDRVGAPALLQRAQAIESPP